MISNNVSLLPYNTFGIDVLTKRFARFSSTKELTSILKEKGKDSLLVLGGGSNILLTKNFNGLAIKNEIKGFEIISEDENKVHIKAGSGEVWHEFVLKTIEKGYGGIENLSLIPGSVGASPMQNIGAYGTEIKDVFISLNAYHIETGEIHSFNKEQCEFGYRESVFKRKLKNQYIIIDVTYCLTKKHIINTKYGVIEKELQEMNITSPTIRDISNAIISIRSSKLPDPKQIGNAGSFFKNPVIEGRLADTLKEKHPNIPNYPAPNDKIKIAAGWLIEQAGWKGKKFNNYGVHKNQALVLVNYSGCSGNDILDLSTKIIEDVHSKFGVTLEREVNIL